MPFFRRRGRSNDASDYSTQTRRFQEKNIVSAIFGTATIVVLCASLVEPVWFQFKGGKCCRSYIGVNIFFSSMISGEFKEDAQNEDCKQSIEQGRNMNESCITAKTLQLMQVIIAFCILAIITSLFSFVLDIIAPRKKLLWKVLKRYAFGYIFTVLLTATTVGFCYWASEDIYRLQFKNREHIGSYVQVSFSTGVYLVTAGGGLAILATASNLMRQYPTEEEEQAEILLEEESDDEHDNTTWSNITGPEPPAYAP